MCQLSRRHHGVTKGWLSMTSALDRLTWWPVDQTCSAKADAATSPFWSACRCSLWLCFRVLPDCPTYTLGHSEQGIWYTTPLRWSMGTGSLGWTSWCLRVLCGRKGTLMSSGPRILLTVSDRPLMYGRVRLVLRSLGHLSLVLAGYCCVSASGEPHWVAILLQSIHNSLLLCHTYHTVEQ